MTLLFILIGAVVWTVVAAWGHAKIHMVLAANCDNCSSGKPYRAYNGDLKMPGSGHNDSYLLALLWPLALPFVMAQWNRPTTKVGRMRIDAYWDKQIADFHYQALEDIRENMDKQQRISNYELSKR